MLADPLTKHMADQTFLEGVMKTGEYIYKCKFDTKKENMAVDEEKCNPCKVSRIKKCESEDLEVHGVLTDKVVFEDDFESSVKTEPR